MYQEVDGTKLWYEKTGQGGPVVLIHGNGESHDIYSLLVPELSKTHTVYAVDSRNHGKSGSTEEIGYDLLASDYISFIKALDLESPTVYGFSDGGIIGLLIAIREPDLLGRLIISGANLDPKGLKFRSRMSMVPKALLGDRLYRMMLREPDIRPDSLRNIKTPTVVLAGEHDCIKRSHTELIASSIPGSTLEIIKGEDHGSYIVKSPKLYGIISKYL